MREAEEQRLYTPYLTQRNQWKNGHRELMALKISDEAKVQMPMKTVASLITLVAIGTWAFFGIQEKLNTHATKLQIMEKDLEMNSEFRIKWPRGLLGSLPR